MDQNNCKICNYFPIKLKHKMYIGINIYIFICIYPNKIDNKFNSFNPLKTSHFCVITDAVICLYRNEETFLQDFLVIPNASELLENPEETFIRYASHCDIFSGY